MRSVTFVILVLLLSCSGLILWADNIPLVSESMHALGDVESFAMYGDYALLIGGDRHLQVMDFSDAEHPRLVAGCDVPGQIGAASSISIYEHYAYLLFSDCLAIISLSNPLTPQFISRIEREHISCQSIFNDVLYVATDWDYYLYAYSLSNPVAPQALDSLWVNNYPSSIACTDGWLVCGNSVVDVINTIDPTNLQKSGELHLISGLEYAFSAAFAFSGSTLVAGCGYYFSVYDFSQEPYLRTPLPLGFLVSDSKGYIHNNRFWCKYRTLDDGNGILGVDFSNLDAPQICFSQTYVTYGIFRFNMNKGLMTLRTNQITRYLSYSILDDNSLPEFELKYPLDSINSIVSQGDWTIGINSNIIQVLGFDEAGDAYSEYNIGTTYYNDITLHNNTLLYTVFNEPYQNGLATRYLVSYDLISKTKKAEIALGYSESSGEIVLDGDKAYICNGFRGLFIVDISNAEQPVLLSQLQEGIEYQCAIAENGKLWVGSGYTIRCYDYRESITPVFCHEIPLYMQTPFIRPYKILMIDNFLYAITLGDKLVRINPDSGRAIEVKIYQTDNPINTHIAKLGDGLMLGSCDGVTVYSLHGEAYPEKVAFREVERVEGTNSVVLTSYAINGDRIYVGRGKSLQVLDARTAIAFTKSNTPGASFRLSTFPNPAKDKLCIICKLPAAGAAELELYNLRGQRVYIKSFTSLNEGLNLLDISTPDFIGLKLGSGVYFARIIQDGFQQTGKLVLVK